jgi:hypothetical protein
MTKLCQEIFGHVSDYIDGACGPEVTRAVRAHLSECAGCRSEFEQWQKLQGELHALPRVQVAPRVALQVRVRISQERHRNLFGRWLVWLDNAVRPLLIPSITGVLTAVVFVGLVLCQGIPPVSSRPDVPVELVIPARVWELAPVDFNTGDQQIVLVTYVNANGRATSYKILSGQHSPQLMNQLDHLVYFSLFRPATVFGQPTNGEVVLSFRRITVRG